MKPLIELNRLSFLIDQTGLPGPSRVLISRSGNVPVLQTPFTVNVNEYRWYESDQSGYTLALQVMVEGLAQDPRWTLEVIAELRLKVKWADQVVEWGRAVPFELVQIELSENSQVLIDERQVDLIPTVNKLLSRLVNQSGFITQSWINAQIEHLSRTYFGSDLLVELLQNLFYQVRSKLDAESGLVELSAAYQQDHFAQTDQAPSYLFLKLPTSDIEYFVGNFDWPDIEVKGYTLKVRGLKVQENGLLEIDVRESGHDWMFKVGLTLTLAGNTITPNVQFIRTEGLGFVTKTLFKLFKGVIKRQIEGRPIDFVVGYANLMDSIRAKYPFIQFQPGDQMLVDALSFHKQRVEIMVHFEKEPVGAVV